MFRAALGYPTRPPHGGRAILVGGGLLVAAYALVGLTGLSTVFAPLALAAPIPWLVVRGYHVRIVRTTISRPNATPPTFEKLGSLLVDGIKATVISAAYLVPGVVVVVAAGTIANLDSFADATVRATAVQATAGIVVIVTLLYLIGALYALPVAVGRFAYTGRLGAAFEVRTVVSGAFTEDYAVAWAFSATIQLVVAPFAYLLYPILIGVFLRFHLSAATRYLYGRGIGDAYGFEPIDAEPDSGSVFGPNVRRAVRPLSDDWHERR